MHVPHQQRQKLDNKSLKCIFVGYALGSKAYRVYDSIGRKMHVIRDVTFAKDNEEMDPASIHIPLNKGKVRTDFPLNHLHHIHLLHLYLLLCLHELHLLHWFFLILAIFLTLSNLYRLRILRWPLHWRRSYLNGTHKLYMMHKLLKESVHPKWDNNQLIMHLWLKCYLLMSLLLLRRHVKIKSGMLLWIMKSILLQRMELGILLNYLKVNKQ